MRACMLEGEEFTKINLEFCEVLLARISDAQKKMIDRVEFQTVPSKLKQRHCHLYRRQTFIRERLKLFEAPCIPIRIA